MKYITGFIAFWYDFIVGDDWRIAVCVVPALGGTAVLARTDVPAWWMLPIAVVLMLALSLWIEARRTR
jgi:hypothetical protein